MSEKEMTPLTEMYADPCSEPFFVVPRHILEMEGMTFSYLKVYEAIFQFWNKGLHCILSESSLVSMTGVKKTQVYAALKLFEKHGHLVRRVVNGKKYLVKPESKIE